MSIEIIAPTPSLSVSALEEVFAETGFGIVDRSESFTPSWKTSIDRPRDVVVEATWYRHFESDGEVAVLRMEPYWQAALMRALSAKTGGFVLAMEHQKSLSRSAFAVFHAGHTVDFHLRDCERWHVKRRDVQTEHSRAYEVVFRRPDIHPWRPNDAIRTMRYRLAGENAAQHDTLDTTREGTLTRIVITDIERPALEDALRDTEAAWLPATVETLVSGFVEDLDAAWKAAAFDPVYDPDARYGRHYAILDHRGPLPEDALLHMHQRLRTCIGAVELVGGQLSHRWLAAAGDDVRTGTSHGLDAFEHAFGRVMSAMEGLVRLVRTTP